MRQRSWFAAGFALLAYGAAVADPPPYAVAGVMNELTPANQLINQVVVSDLGQTFYDGSPYLDLFLTSTGLPYVQADAAFADGFIPPLTQGQSQIELGYGLEIVGPGGPVSMIIAAELHAEFASDPGSAAAASAFFSVFDLASGAVVWQNAIGVQTGDGSNGNSAFQQSQQFSLLANHPYGISLLAAAAVRVLTIGVPASASASADPTFTFADGVDASLYTLSFSPGIGNGNVVVAVPEPSEILLMLSGLATIVAWRRARSQR